MSASQCVCVCVCIQYFSAAKGNTEQHNCAAVRQNFVKVPEFEIQPKGPFHSPFRSQKHKKASQWEKSGGRTRKHRMTYAQRAANRQAEGDGKFCLDKNNTNISTRFFVII